MWFDLIVYNLSAWQDLAINFLLTTCVKYSRLLLSVLLLLLLAVQIAVAYFLAPWIAGLWVFLCLFTVLGVVQSYPLEAEEW